MRRKAVGHMSTPSRSECLSILKQCGTPEAVVAHSLAVEAAAMKLALRFPRADASVISAAALLHDALRTEKGHPSAAADMLESMGYSSVAEAVRGHHDLSEQASTEAKLVALADKLTDGTSAVTIDVRFEKSAKKCVTPEAKAAHERRYKEAKALERELIGDSEQQ